MGTKNNQGSTFTIKDLLTAILLLGVVAVLVLAIINPVEQANRTRDAEYKNFASQLIATEQRHGSAEAFGYQDVSMVPTLKAAFADKVFITRGTDLGAAIYIGKAAGASSLVYACYVPTSNSERIDACKNGKVYTLSSAMGVRKSVAPAACTSPAVWQETSQETAWVVCVPD